MDSRTFLDTVAKASGLEKEICSSFIEAFTELVEVSLAQGDVVSIPSFGNFESRKRNERIMSHPSSPGKKLLVPPKVVASFKPSAVLKNKINEVEANEQ